MCTPARNSSSPGIATSWETPTRRGPAVDVPPGAKQLAAGDRDLGGDADEAEVAAGWGGSDGLHLGLLRADRLDDAVRAEPAGQLLHLRDTGLTAFGDDVG